jgi:hypothetical protein
MTQATPVAKYKAGSVSVALWSNIISIGGKKTTVLKTTLERRYKDSDGTWKSSGSFARNELPLAMWCLQKAFDHMIENANNHSDDSIEEETIG